MSTSPSERVLEAFHPAVRTWFERKFPEGPTEPQIEGWPAIAQNVDTLIAAPTGSGKTLSAFLICIDRLYQRAAKRSEDFCLDAPEQKVTEVVYVSPLKALGADIKKNLDEPIAEIAEIAKKLGCVVPEIRVAVRSGDTTPSQRAAMLRRPPQFLITTPESLYLMITAERSREILRGVRTVIVEKPFAGDEAAARDLLHRCSVSGKRVLVNHQRAYDPCYRAIERRVQGGLLGRIQWLVGHAYGGALNGMSHVLERAIAMLGPVQMAEAVGAPDAAVGGARPAAGAAVARATPPTPSRDST